MRRLFTLTVLAVSTCISGVACTYFPKTVQTGPSFTITVRNSGRPLANLALSLTIGEKALLTVMTDAQGVAHFVHVPNGSYYIKTPIDYILSPIIEVSSKRSQISDIRVKWPQYPVLEAAVLKGRLRINEVTPPLKFTLLDAVTGHELLTMDKASKDGEFDFSKPYAGLYVLRVSEDEPHKEFFAVEGDIFVDLKSSATDYLMVGGAMSSCGLSYAAIRNQKPIEVSRACGHLLDESGVVIGNARLNLLRRDTHNVTATARSDSLGKFDLPAPEGDYDLSVFSTGFIPALFSLRVANKGNEACIKPIKVTLSVGSSSRVEASLREPDAQTR